MKHREVANLLVPERVLQLAGKQVPRQVRLSSGGKFSHVSKQKFLVSNFLAAVCSERNCR